MVCMYIIALWTGNCLLHLFTLDVYTRYFFTLDKLAILVYLAEMKQFEKKDANYWWPCLIQANNH